MAQNSLPASASPYRLLDDQGQDVGWANQFLDAQKLRQLSPRSLRAYAYDLLHLARWLEATRHSLPQFNQALLLDYVRSPSRKVSCSLAAANVAPCPILFTEPWPRPPSAPLVPAG